MKTSTNGKTFFTSEITVSPTIPPVSIRASVDEAGKGSVAIEWNDGVVNGWTEVYEDMATALLRLAALAKCAESGWDKMFAQGDGDFATVAKFVLNGLVA
jgi:hypothetical protein